MRGLGLWAVLLWAAGCGDGDGSGGARDVEDVDSVHDVGDGVMPHEVFDTSHDDGDGAGVDVGEDVDSVDDVHMDVDDDGLGPDGEGDGDAVRDGEDVADLADLAEGETGEDGETGHDVEDGLSEVEDGVSDTPDTVDTADTGETGETGETGDTTPDPYAGLADESLRAVLRAEATLGHTPLGYNGSRDAMYAVGGLDDVGGRIECIYTGRTVDATGSRTPNRNCRKADGTPITCSFNTEHTWARYYLRAALTEGTTAYNAAEGDIHHLRPSDDDVNNARWHFDFGETNCPADGACKVSEGSELGQRRGITGHANCPTGNLTLSHVCVMEVRPERQGDIARGMFYMATRYGMAMDDAMEDILRAWNRSDPPDARERTRNDGIHAAQGNRNAFVDWPGLVDRISDF